MNILEALKEVKEPRTKLKNIRYPLEEILFMCLSGLMSGCKSWEQIAEWGETRLEWLKRFYDYKHGICSEDTLIRVFRMLNFKQFTECFAIWVNSIVKASDQIALDGKYLNGNSKIGMIHAYDINTSALLNITDIEGKGHEIEGLKSLIPLISNKKALISIDSLGCQTEIIELIIKNKSDYLIQVKGNQGNLHEDIKYYCAENQAKTACAAEVEKDNGRVCERECRVYTHVDWLNDRNEGFKIKSFMHTIRTRYDGGKITRQEAYHISSKVESGDYFLEKIRNHWHIENKLHWVLDVIFDEDNNKTYDKNQAKNLALMLRIAVSLVKQQATSDKKPISKTLFKNLLEPDRINQFFKN
jgi:predicted transposase YbfD/YdcC